MTLKMTECNQNKTEERKIVAYRGKNTGSIYLQSGYNICPRGNIHASEKWFYNYKNYPNLYVPIYEGDLCLKITG